MKYEEAYYECDGVRKKLEIRGISVEKMEEMCLSGQFFCPGVNCTAKLCLVHSSKNLGKTCYLKAVDDKTHSKNCDYKNENVVKARKAKTASGYITEKQSNDAVRQLMKEFLHPTPMDSKKTKRKTTRRKRSEDDGENVTAKAASGDRIVFGETGEDSIKGRIQRAYEVTNDDVGKVKKIGGIARRVYLDSYNRLIVEFEDRRLKNIKAVVGEIYEHAYPNLFEFLFLVVNYFKKAKEQRQVAVVVSGLISKKGEDFYIDIQSNGGIRIEDKTVMKLVSEHARKGLK